MIPKSGVGRVCNKKQYVRIFTGCLLGHSDPQPGTADPVDFTSSTIGSSGSQGLLSLLLDSVIVEVNHPRQHALFWTCSSTKTRVKETIYIYIYTPNNMLNEHVKKKKRHAKPQKEQHD